MPGLSGTLDIARWSLYASQLAMEVTAHNIANANTEGYSKQSLRIETNPAISIAPGQLGTGVKGVEVYRAYDDFITKQVTMKRSDYNYWSSQNTAMEEIEMVFNESGGYGINNLMGQFWNAWSDVSNNPDGIPERDALIGKSTNLVQAIKDIDYNLRSNQRNLNSNIQGAVEKVNSILQQIADINGQISSVEIKGSVNANDLRDQREKLLNDLSEYMDISYYEEQQSGQVMVYILGGTPLVLGVDAYSLSSERNATTGNTDVMWNDSSGREVNITHRLKGGKIAGWVNVRDTRIGSYLDSLNTLTGELIWQVNDLHSLGTGLNPVSSMTGTVEITDPTAAIDGAGNYSFNSRFTAGGSFDIVTYDAAGNVSSMGTVTLAAGTAVNDLIAAVNGITNMNAALDADNHLQLTADAGFTFAIKPSTSGESNHALAILGVNSYFTWDAQAGDFTETVGVNPALESNLDLIAAGRLDSNNLVAPGGNTTALAIFGLQDKVIDMGGNNTTMDAYYSSFISEVGVHTQNAQMNEKYNDTLLGEYVSRKESVAGVNLDEEMADLLKFQHAYQAASKLIAVSDEMLQTLLSVKQ